VGVFFIGEGDKLHAFRVPKSDTGGCSGCLSP
jgi:hypothetical protein